MEATTATRPRDRGTLGPCLRCKGRELSIQNKCGLCLKCWNEVGPVTRAFYLERFNEQNGRAA